MPRVGEGTAALRVVLLFLLTFLGTLPLQGAPDPAREDLELSRLLARQGSAATASLQCLEDWSAGRCSGPEALRRAADADEEARALQRAVDARVRTSGPPLAAPAKSLAADRAAQAAEALGLVRAGRAAAADLARFAEARSRLAGERLAGWLRARLDLARRMLVARPAGALVQYYRWQADLLPLQLEQVILAGDVRRALQGPPGRAHSAPGLAGRGRSLAQRVAALRVPASLAAAREASVREAESLASLAEAADLAAGDPSPESSSRVARWSRALRQDSARAEQESLGALSRALGP